jgi:hypothetical protein
VSQAFAEDAGRALGVLELLGQTEEEETRERELLRVQKEKEDDAEGAAGWEEEEQTVGPALTVLRSCSDGSSLLL